MGPASLDAELRALRKRRGEQLDLHSAGIITKADLARGMRDITDRTAALKAQLADITFAPVAPSGPVFREDSVLITWKA